jgi:hypothetical protein
MAEHGSPLEQCYAGLDRKLGMLLDQEERSTNVIVLFNLGMGPHYEGTHLVAPILRRLHRWLVAPDGARTGRVLRRTLVALPRSLARLVTPFAVRAVRQQGWRTEDTELAGMLTGDERRGQAFFQALTDHEVGGVRLNLAGREDDGVVDPNQADTMLRWLEQQFRALVDLATGRPIVARTMRCQDLYPTATDPGLADLYLEWTSERPLERVWSPTIGVLHVEPPEGHTGSHRDTAMVVARGPDIVPGSHEAIPTGAVPAGLARLIGVPLPEAVHPAPTWWGRP